MRQRRRDLALLKTVGFREVAVGRRCGVAGHGCRPRRHVVGIPVGIVTGRWLWDLFARQIYAVPYPTFSVPSIALVALGTLILANVVAAVPARNAARTPTALMLRAE